MAELGSNLEAQEAPKSRPEPAKIDVEKQHVFSIDFGRVRTSFWKGFRYVFWSKNAMGSNRPGAASSAADLEAQEAPKSRPKPPNIDVEKQHVFSIDF